MTKSATHHYGKVIHGMLTYYNKPLLDLEIRNLEGLEFDLILKEKKKRVSLDTHGYYRGGVIREALKYKLFTGWTEDSMHDFFSSIFLKRTKIHALHRDHGIEQQPVTTIKSTSDLSQVEMNQFIENVIRWLDAEGIVIHPPEQYYLNQFKSHEK